jgi:ferredoxin
VFAAPQVFDLDDAGKAVVLVGDPTDDHIAAVRDAVADCPARAIELAG